MSTPKTLEHSLDAEILSRALRYFIDDMTQLDSADRPGDSESALSEARLAVQVLDRASSVTVQFEPKTDAGKQAASTRTLDDYGEWKRAVNDAIMDATGWMTADDLPDQPYADWF